MDWTLYGLLLGGALVSVAAVLPYAFTINADKLTQAPFSLPVMALVSLLQSGILFAIGTGLGLLAIDYTGLSLPHFTAIVEGASVTPIIRDIAPLAIAAGVLVGIAIVGLEVLVFQDHLPEELRERSAKTALWKRAGACLYGGWGEEVLMRLFLVTALAWSGGLIWATGDGLPTDAVLWGAIVLASVVFGLGHLPATAAITPLTRILVIRALLLNGIGGLVFGYLYWQEGLLVAMLAHMSTDVVLHIIAPIFQPLAAKHSENNQPAYSVVE